MSYRFRPTVAYNMHTALAAERNGNHATVPEPYSSRSKVWANPSLLTARDRKNQKNTFYWNFLQQLVAASQIAFVAGVRPSLMIMK